MDATFRIAEIPDIDTLVQFMWELYDFDKFPFDEQIARVALENLVNNDSLGRVWLIEHEGQAIGYVVLTLGYSLEYHGGGAFVDELYIRPSHRGQGLGARTL